MFDKPTVSGNGFQEQRDFRVCQWLDFLLRGLWKLRRITGVNLYHALLLGHRKRFVQDCGNVLHCL